MKLSQITAENVREYLRLAEDEDENTLEIIMKAAERFIKGYTSLDDEQLDEHEDLSIVFMILCSEMYDVRTYTVNNDRLNPAVKTILDMYSQNYVGGEVI